MVEKIGEKNDKIGYLITNTLPYYENYKQEQLALPLDRDEKVENVNEKQIYSFNEPLESIEQDFLSELSENKKVFYIQKVGKDVYSDEKIIGISNLIKSSDDELNDQYKSKDLMRLGNELVAYYKYNKDNKQVLMYHNAIGKYQNIIKYILASRNI